MEPGVPDVATVGLTTVITSDVTYPVLDVPGSGDDAVEVRLVCEGFRSAYSRRAFRRGESIGTFTGERSPEINLYTLQLSERVHVIETGPFVTLNHACKPNTAFMFNPVAYDEKAAHRAPIEELWPTVVALRDIAAGEPLTFNYCSTEWEMASPFDCLCGAAECAGTIRGYRHLSPRQRLALSGIVAPHICRLARAEREELERARDAVARGEPKTRVCVLVCTYVGSTSDLAAVDDYARTPAHFFGYEVVDGTPVPVGPTGSFPAVVASDRFEYSFVPIRKATAFSQVRDLVRSGRYDVFFNLCDGALDYDVAGVEVVQALEHFGVPFTGATSKYYEPSKVDMKVLATYAGLNVPPYFLVNGAGEVREELARSGLRFPVIVKHVSGYSSVGMTRSSKCSTAEELEAEVARFCGQYGEALVEEFIEGTEVTVLSTEVPPDESYNYTAAASIGHGPVPSSPCVSFAPIQIRFPEGDTFKHFELKWEAFDGMQWSPVRRPDLNVALRQAGVDALRSVMGGRGFGRSDFRIDADGKIWFLEINPNCGVFYPVGYEGSADVILRADPLAGQAHFAELCVAVALKHAVLARADVPAWELFYSVGSGYGVRARRDIEAGEVVFNDEGAPFHLVSRAHVEDRWPAGDRAMFARYAWPVADGLFAIWSEDYRRWRPVNHSCNPNLWFGERHSLNVYARAAIPRGTQLTMDYATFCAGEYMQEFPCACGAPTCRGTITGSDFAKHPALRETYGTRVTDFVYGMGRA